MSKAYLGSYHGTTTPEVNMVDVFKAKELEEHPNSILGYGPLVLTKLAISAAPNTVVEINDQKITMFSGVFELGRGEIDVTKLVFHEAMEIFVYYMY